MKYIILISLLVLPFIFAESEHCPVYKCNKDDSSDVCFSLKQNDTDTEITVKKCPTGKQCEEGEKAEKKCIDKANATNLLPGQACSTNDQCLSGTCTNNVCVGKAEKEACYFHETCGVGLYCANPSATEAGKCTTQKPAGQDCSSDYECENDSGCLFQKCTKYYSLEQGEKTTYKKFCKSNMYVTHEGVDKCADFYLVNDKEECIGTDTCTYRILLDGKVLEDETSDCQCSMVYATRTFCQLGGNDTLYKDAIKAYTEHYEKDSKTLHTKLRNHIYDYDKLKRINLGLNSAYFKDAPDCLIQYELSIQGLKISSMLLLVLSLFLL